MQQYARCCTALYYSCQIREAIAREPSGEVQIYIYLAAEFKLAEQARTRKVREGNVLFCLETSKNLLVFLVFRVILILIGFCLYYFIFT